MAEDQIISALKNCDADKALEPGDPRYYDLDPVRHTVRKRIVRFFQSVENQGSGERGYVKLVLTGHRGADKTTELNRIEQDLIEAGYLICYASVDMRLDPHDIGFSDVIRLLLTLLHQDAFAKESQDSQPLRLAFQNVADWYLQITSTHKEDFEEVLEKGVRLAPGLKVGIEPPRLSRRLINTSYATSAGHSSEA